MSFTNYIVKFKDDVSDIDYKKVLNDVKSAGGSIVHEHTLFKGFTAKLPDDRVTSLSLHEHPHIDHVEKDQEVKIQ
ncbi:protease B inhibitor 2 [Trichomonascus vanleenenianus]|uniref:protease B inhibitor 2 n=1 Tax=Trichomonascus vanleenenianus TaxID=2268995 RepID=UPI003EC9E0A4